MTVKLTRQYKFAASHRLHSDALSEVENQATYGKCNNPFGHGHDYVLQVVTRGRVDPVTGQLLNIDRLDQVVDEALLRDFRNSNLNDLAAFQTLVPTTENLAAVAEQRLREAWPCAYPNGEVLFSGVRILETARNSFETSQLRNAKSS